MVSKGNAVRESNPPGYQHQMTQRRRLVRIRECRALGYTSYDLTLKFSFLHQMIKQIITMTHSMATVWASPSTCSLTFSLWWFWAHVVHSFFGILKIISLDLLLSTVFVIYGRTIIIYSFFFLLFFNNKTTKLTNESFSTFCNLMNSLNFGPIS